MKKFIAPQLVLILVLSAVWWAGVDTIVVRNDDHQDNLHKYLQVQRRVMDNYYGETSLNQLFERSLVGLVLALEDSSLNLEDTPIDTTRVWNIQNLRDSYNKFEEAYLYIANNFPDQDMTRATERSIREMLSILDPHSVYIGQKESATVQEQFDGKFQGIGIEFTIIDDTITVVSPLSGGPSEQLGIMSGDRIVAIDDSSAIGFTNEDVISRLRGEKGTTVNVRIKRPGSSGTINYTIERDDIPITTVDTQYMLDDRTGYLKINRFAATTHSEFLASVNHLEAQGMERLVLDLQSNPGGYLSQAIAISEEFFPRGTKLVSTQSRHSRFNSEAISGKDGLVKDLPVIVLVNEGSASASEIVSGAIQDHDRGLVVGRRTFGKGLVQQQYELIDKSNIRVTISRYYTPLGRLIQKPFDGRNEDYAYEIQHVESDEVLLDTDKLQNKIPDSLQYSTPAGQIVYGGGGITPHHIVQSDTTRPIELFVFMRAKRVEFDFVRTYLDRNGETFRAQWENDFDSFRSEFEWNEEDETKFLSAMQDAGLQFSDDATKPTIEEDTLYISPQMYDELKWMNLGDMKAQLARQVWGIEYHHIVHNDYFNDALKEAMTLWEAVEQLAILAQQNNERMD